MKKIIYFILFIMLFLSSGYQFTTNAEFNTESNIKKAILVEDYILRHKNKIEEFIKKYSLPVNSNLTKDIEVLDESIEALRKIQNTNIDKSKAENIIQAIIIRIKNVNESLEAELRKEKSIYEAKIEKKLKAYSVLWIKLSDKIDSINLKIAQNIFKDKKVLSLKESKIKLNLIKLNKESQKLRNFWNINFKSEKEIKDSFIRILKNIKREITLMKNTLK